ncbi:MAG: cell division protein FtsA [Candidatus Cryptobacteroides sp.]
MDERHLVAVDLGTSKIALTVAKVEGDNTQVVYYREVPSDGIRYSYVSNPMRASVPVRRLLEDASAELGIQITQVIVGMPKYEVKQETASLKVPRSENECITREEVENLRNCAADSYPLDDPEHEALFGSVAQSYSTSEEFQLVEEDIIGMASSQMEGNFKLFIGRKSALMNIERTFKNAGVCIARKYFTPDSTARAVLHASEMENGVALIDLGAGATSVSVYYGGIMRHYASIPFGGRAITHDIQSEASISERLAENIKLAFGACMPDKLLSMSEKTIQIDSGGAAPAKHLNVKYLSEIITARQKEIVEAMLYEIECSGFADNLKSGVVITGGGAALANCANFIKELSGYNVRTGYPIRLFSSDGCDGVNDTRAVTSIGMILAAKNEKGLNCTMPAEERESEDEVLAGGVGDGDTLRTDVEIPAEEGQGTPQESEGKGTSGTLEGFGISEEERKKAEEELKRKKKEKKKRSSIGIWFKQVGNSLTEASGNLYKAVSDEIARQNEEEV